MKQNQITSLMRPGFASMAVKPGRNLCLLAGRPLAVWALLTQCLAPGRAAEVVPFPEAGNQSTPARKPAYTPHGQQMERYQAFARQAELPVIMVAGNTTLEVGGTVRTDLNRLAVLSLQEKEALAGQFGVPAAVIGKVAERAANHPPLNATQFAQDIRAAVIDYRFLQREWERYHPSAAGQKIKEEALAVLQAGDISKAWELYDGLQRPSAPKIARPPAPTGLRVVSQK